MVLGWRVRTPRTRRRTAVPAERLPPGILQEGWPAANDPQTPSLPGTKRPPGFGHPPAGSATSRAPRGLALGRTIRSHGRAPKGTLLTPSGRDPGRTHGRSGEAAAGGRRPPCLACGRQRGPNITRHSEAAVQAGKMCSDERHCHSPSHRSTGLTWALIVRANVPGPGLDSGGPRFVW